MTVPANVSSPAYSVVARRHKIYRGGFRSSLCGLFTDPSRRADCCAVACCGILQSDKNRYLLNGERPSWWKRLSINVGFPVAVLLLVSALILNDAGPSLLYLVFGASIAGLCIRARRIRMQLRKEIMDRMHQEQRGGSDVEICAARQERDICCAHFTCCGCYHEDAAYVLDDGDDDDDNVEEEPVPDLCTIIFQSLALFCCGVFFQCWCQCCGICAIGQEEREISALVPKHQQLIDYLTFEPFTDYYPRIVELRTNATDAFCAHLRAISVLSKKLLIALGSSLLLLTVLALTGVDTQFQGINLLLLIAVFLQAFFVLHFVHWRWHRFDLSFDAIIKFFSSGFFLATSLALVYEYVLSYVFGLALSIILLLDLVEEIPTDESDEETQKWFLSYLHSHVWLFVIGVFFESYVVAALVEELCKYFSFWMVWHPDFMCDEDWNSITAQETSEETESKPKHSVIQSLVEHEKERTLTSKGAAITIGMVTASLGFACCENLIYVFLGSPGARVGREAETLLVRSLFPIHPIAAAIQSIGVCRRDLEGDKSFGLGRIILPAVILHGTYDFILFLVALIIGSRHFDDLSDPNEKNADVKETPADMRLELISLGLGFIVVLLGMVYYVEGSRSQKKRLQELERIGSHRNEDAPLVV